MNQRVETRTDGSIAEVIFSRPDKLNALDLEMIKAIISAGEALSDRKDIRAVILRGSGAAFCAGLDLNAMPKIGKLAMEEGGLEQRPDGKANLFQRVAMVWQELPMPVIGCLHGHVLGGGLQIAMGADIRIAAPDTKFAIMEGRWGLIPDMGGMLLLRRQLRQDRLRLLTYTAEKIGTEQALDWGLITEISSDPLARSQELAQAIASKSPDAIRAAKRLITDCADLDPGAVLKAESAAQSPLIGSKNQMEAVMAGMLKRPPNFQD